MSHSLTAHDRQGKKSSRAQSRALAKVQMTPTAPEVVKQFLAGDCKHYRGRDDAHGRCYPCVTPDLVELLTTFAQAREHMVFQECMEVLKLVLKVEQQTRLRAMDAPLLRRVKQALAHAHESS